MSRNKKDLIIDLDISRCGIGDNLDRTKELINNILNLNTINLNNYLDVPFVKDMMETEQDPVYHEEGNVLIHTQMVMDNVLKLKNNKEINDDEAVILYMSALLHDVAKYETSVESNGRIKSKQHDLVGFKKSRYIMDSCMAPLDIKIRSLSIIREHVSTLSFINQNPSKKAYERLSWKVNTRLLYFFNKCDFSGRIAEGIKESLEKLEIFKDNCKYYDVFGKYPKKYKEISKYKAIVLIGQAASGKSTYAKKYKEINNKTQIISSDEIRGEICRNESEQSKNEDVFKIFYKRIREADKNKIETLILDATNLNKRDKLIKTLQDSGYGIEIIFFDTPLNESLSRNKKRERFVPEDVVKRQYEFLVYPNYSESSNIKIIDIHNNELEFPKVSCGDFSNEDEKPFELSAMNNGFSLEVDNDVIRLPKISNILFDLNNIENRNWVTYLRPTMSPCDSSGIDGYLEHPEDVFKYFKSKGVNKIIYEHKYMGSCSTIVLCRNKKISNKYFNDPSRIGVIFSRKGKPFFDNDKIINTLYNKWKDYMVQNKVEYIVLEAEILPWNLKADGLIKKQYEKSGDSGFFHYKEIYNNLQWLDDDHYRLKCEIGNKLHDIEKYNEMYKFYCWSREDVKIHPFHVLAIKYEDGNIFNGFNEEHVKHLEIIKELSDNKLVLPVSYGFVDLNSNESMLECIEEWKKYTEMGYEGFVFKPLKFTTYIGKELIQPAVKCRGRDYLRIIYGFNYLHRLDSLRRRSTGKKRRNAIHEFLLGKRSMDLFLENKPCHEYHKYIIGILAKETDPIDPRL